MHESPQSTHPKSSNLSANAQKQSIIYHYKAELSRKVDDSSY